jgi:hypothetical protein
MTEDKDCYSQYCKDFHQHLIARFENDTLAIQCHLDHAQVEALFKGIIFPLTKKPNWQNNSLITFAQQELNHISKTTKETMLSLYLSHFDHWDSKILQFIFSHEKTLFDLDNNKNTLYNHNYIGLLTRQHPRDQVFSLFDILIESRKTNPLPITADDFFPVFLFNEKIDDKALQLVLKLLKHGWIHSNLVNNVVADLLYALFDNEKISLVRKLLSTNIIDSEILMPPLEDLFINTLDDKFETDSKERESFFISCKNDNAPFFIKKLEGYFERSQIDNAISLMRLHKEDLDFYNLKTDLLTQKLSLFIASNEAITEKISAFLKNYFGIAEFLELCIDHNIQDYVYRSLTTSPNLIKCIQLEKAIQFFGSLPISKLFLLYKKTKNDSIRDFIFSEDNFIAIARYYIETENKIPEEFFSEPNITKWTPKKVYNFILLFNEHTVNKDIFLAAVLPKIDSKIFLDEALKTKELNLTSLFPFAQNKTLITQFFINDLERFALSTQDIKDLFSEIISTLGDSATTGVKNFIFQNAFLLLEMKAKSNNAFLLIVKQKLAFIDALKNKLVENKLISTEECEKFDSKFHSLVNLFSIDYTQDMTIEFEDEQSVLLLTSQWNQLLLFCLKYKNNFDMSRVETTFQLLELPKLLFLPRQVFSQIVQEKMTETSRIMQEMQKENPIYFKHYLCGSSAQYTLLSTLTTDTDKIAKANSILNSSDVDDIVIIQNSALKDLYPIIIKTCTELNLKFKIFPKHANLVDDYISVQLDDKHDVTFRDDKYQFKTFSNLSVLVGQSADCAGDMILQDSNPDILLDHESCLVRFPFLNEEKLYGVSAILSLDQNQAKEALNKIGFCLKNILKPMKCGGNIDPDHAKVLSTILANPICRSIILEYFYSHYVSNAQMSPQQFEEYKQFFQQQLVPTLNTDLFTPEDLMTDLTSAQQAKQKGQRTLAWLHNPLFRDEEQLIGAWSYIFDRLDQYITHPINIRDYEILQSVFSNSRILTALFTSIAQRDLMPLAQDPLQYYFKIKELETHFKQVDTKFFGYKPVDYPAISLTTAFMGYLCNYRWLVTPATLPMQHAIPGNPTNASTSGLHFQFNRAMATTEENDRRSSDVRSGQPAVPAKKLN